MSDSLPKTADAVLAELTDIETEYAHDHGVEKHYGLGLSATLYLNGQQVNVLGSLVLDPETGRLAEHVEPTIVAFPDGMIEDEEELVSGDEAVTVFEEVFDHSDFDSPYQPRKNVSIDPSAM